jgi:hypothetical protein
VFGINKLDLVRNFESLYLFPKYSLQFLDVSHKGWKGERHESMDKDVCLEAPTSNLTLVQAPFGGYYLQLEPIS